MRLVQSLSTGLILAAAATSLAVAQTAPSGPPTSGWAAPGAAPGAAAPAQAAPPPSSGWGTPAPGGGFGGAGGGIGGPGAGGGPTRDCAGEFIPLRQDAEKKAAAIKTAAATKKQPVVCAAFKTFATAEAKVIKYIEEYGAECRVPPEALKAMRANHAKTIEVRTKVCDVAAAPQPRAPSLSDALGTSRIPSAPESSPTQRKGGGTFDTLTGNSLAR